MEQMDIFEQMLKPLPKVSNIKLGTFFSGIGAPEKALKKIGIDYELMFFSEIDKYAIQSYCAIHNEPIEKNKGDITKIQGKDLPYCDMWFGGFPCQDISLAGKQRGFTKGIGSRSSLGWEMIRLLDEVEEKPKYIIFENVANIMSEAMRPTLNLFKEDLEARGYTLYNQILNAKDYGIPQNRERYFLVAVLGNYYYKFPPKQKLELRLKDMLEDEVDEKYYLKDYQRPHQKRGVVQKQMIQTLKTSCDDVGVVTLGNYSKSNHNASRIVDKTGISPTVMENHGTVTAVESNLRIRKLTPLECYRLMGFDDEDYRRASQVCSNSQLYRQAGNSIVVNVLMAIFRELFL